MIVTIYIEFKTMIDSSDFDDKTPLQNENVRTLKEKTKNHKSVCCCLTLSIILMYICITFGQRNRMHFGYD